MDKSNFSIPAVKQIMTALLDNSIEFESRKKGDVFKAVVFTIAGIFPEDRLAIYQAMGSSIKEQPKGGGAKITRVKPAAAQRKKGTPPCDGCPEVAISTTPIRKQPRGVEPRQSPINQDAKRLGAFEDVEQVLETFESSTLSIRAWAQANDIHIPSNVSKPETAASYIVKHFQNQNTSDEEE